MRIFLLLTLQLYVGSVFAMEFGQLQNGSGLELTENLLVNKLNGGADLQCHTGTATIFPRITIGSKPGVGVVPLRYFTVSSVTKDLLTYSINLQSEQMPCSCVLTISQSLGYAQGSVSNFQMLVPADPAAMAKEAAVPSACSNFPDWSKSATPFDDDDGTISL